MSILVEQLEEPADGSRTCKIDFLVRDLVRPSLHPGSRLLVLEGARIVGDMDVWVVHDDS
ncbi:hypothetical protein AB0M48_35655 [Lentzea sp. NPDC051208]|uniref:hypothetical protein n=1 Tax=Lentzea sp. NPDC051208 TaxID=3154642 RepID=UPI003443BC4A